MRKNGLKFSDLGSICEIPSTRGSTSVLAIYQKKEFCRIWPISLVVYCWSCNRRSGVRFLLNVFFSFFCSVFMLLCLHVLDSYVVLRDDRRSVFAFFFAAWPEFKPRVLTSPGNFWHSCDRWVLSRVAFTVAEV